MKKTVLATISDFATHVMPGKRGQEPQQGEVYGRAKRATIDREITDHAIDFIKRKAKQPFSPTSPIRKPMIRPPSRGGFERIDP